MQTSRLKVSKPSLFSLAAVLAVIIILNGSCAENGDEKKTAVRFEPTWESLRNNKVPQWLRDGKFGIYTHWGVYAVHGMGPNGTWYANAVYKNENSWQRKHWEETYGTLDEFGYKDLIPGVGVVDLELGQEPELTHHEWITDSSVDDQGAWSYVKDAEFKSVNRLVDNLVDRVSKNGYLLLNVGPKPDGTIPDEAKECLLGIGEWLNINGEAIYGTTAWTFSGEGPSQLERGKDAMFNEKDINYTAGDIRFTVKGDTLYAVCLDWPGEEAVIYSLAGHKGYSGLYKDEIKEITMLGDGKPLEWELDDKVLHIKTPQDKPCEHAYVFKIVRHYR